MKTSLSLVLAGALVFGWGAMEASKQKSNAEAAAWFQEVKAKPNKTEAEESDDSGSSVAMYHANGWIAPESTLKKRPEKLFNPIDGTYKIIRK